MKILLLGQNGQLGWELQRALAPLGRLIALDRRDEGGLCGNLERFDDLRETVRKVRPTVIVNAAAYTAVDRAESDPERAALINSEAPGILAEEAVHLNALLVHYSTDYVFDGSGSSPWCEEDVASPLSVYGSTKWRGEELLRNAGPLHIVLRAGWIYSALGRNFIRTILRLASERDSLEIVSDQVGAPTGAELIADCTAHAVRSTLLDPALSGTYHIAALGETTWYDYARFIVETARNAGWPINVALDAITPVASDAFPTPARRPKNCRLAVGKFEQAFDISMPDWSAGVKRTLTEILSAQSRKELA